MEPTLHTAHQFAVIARLCEETRRMADQIVARARAARKLGATARAYRRRALELNRQLGRAEGLLFGQVVETLCAAVAESGLIADAPETIESGEGQ